VNRLGRLRLIMATLCRGRPLEVEWRFRIKEFVEGAQGTCHRPLGDGSSGTLPAGAEVRSWNGVPIERWWTSSSLDDLPDPSASAQPHCIA
jgi:hypothetical protein